MDNPVEKEMLENKIKLQEEENKRLNEKLEITQAVVDEIALGGL